jgi:hypothetical protein
MLSCDRHRQTRRPSTVVRRPPKIDGKALTEKKSEPNNNECGGETISTENRATRLDAKPANNGVGGIKTIPKLRQVKQGRKR